MVSRQVLGSHVVCISKECFVRVGAIDCKDLRLRSRSCPPKKEAHKIRDRYRAAWQQDIQISIIDTESRPKAMEKKDDICVMQGFGFYNVAHLQSWQPCDLERSISKYSGSSNRGESSREFRALLPTYACVC